MQGNKLVFKRQSATLQRAAPIYHRRLPIPTPFEHYRECWKTLDMCQQQCCKLAQTKLKNHKTHPSKVNIIELQLHELDKHSLLFYVSAWLEHSVQPWLWVRVALSFKRNSAKDGASYNTKSNSVKSATDCHSIHIYHQAFAHDSMCICICTLIKHGNKMNEWNAEQNTQHLVSFSRKTLLSVSLRPHISVGSSSKTTLQHRIPARSTSYWLTFSSCRYKRHALTWCGPMDLDKECILLPNANPCQWAV